jgi:hypothetical protein
VTAVALLGIPHPTGYPLDVLLGKTWTMIFPFGSIAWRMSIFSAACAALARGITSSKKMDDAEAAGRAIEAGSNFFFRSTQVR